MLIDAFSVGERNRKMTPMLMLAFAFSGSYFGLGEAIDINGWTADCTQVSVTVVETAQTVTLSKHGFSCGAVSSAHDPITLEKRFDGLYLANKKVGGVSSTEIDAIIASDISDLSVLYRIVRRGDGVIYKETWLSEQDGVLDETFDMSGELSRLP